MVDLDILKKAGVSVEKLKDVFTLKKQKESDGFTTIFAIDDESQKGQLNRLRRRIRSRIQGGRDFNLSNYRMFHALDTAWDMPLKQITPTMLMSLLDKNQEPQTVINTLQSWGIDPDEALIEVPDPKSPDKTQKKVSIPAFFRIFIPLAKAYVTIRWAKLVNDRNQVPHYKYEPAISDQISRMRCEVITAAVEDMSNNYSYFDDEKQAIHKMLHYGQCFLFPQEAWHYEEQLVGKDSGYKGETVKVDGMDCIKAVVKEGIRHHQPHPARCYYDQAHYPSTFNTDSGATYAGYWRIMRYKEIVGNKNFWNLDAIKVSNGAWYTPGQGIFANVYPCTIQFPSTSAASEGVGDHDSEKHIGDGFYTTELEDRGLVINEYFEKMIPSENGLGDYDYPVWFRFVIAGDDTIIFCEPIAYCPIVYYGYDAAEGRTVQSSMTLEVLPAQDHLSNLFTQYIASVKSNLVSLNLVDTDVLDEKHITRMETPGFWSFLGPLIVRFSGKKFQTQQTNPKAIYQERPTQVDTQSIAIAMRLILEMVERLLVMSPQEMGQAATHEQTREEVKVISQQSSARLEFTAAAADRAREAIKRQLYEGLMAYGEDEFYAQIPADPELDQQKLLDLGFTWRGMDTTTGRVTVKATKTAVSYQKFVANRDGADRINEEQLAAKMVNVLTLALNNPLGMQAIGPDQFIQLINQLARTAGFPRDFKLVNKMNDKSLLQQNNEEVLKQVQQLLQASQQDFKGAIEHIVKDNEQQAQSIAQIEKILQQLEAAVQPPQPAVTPMAASPPAIAA